MARRLSILALALLAGVAAGCRTDAEPPQADEEVDSPTPPAPPAQSGEITITGDVEWFDGGVAIGGEADPTGYVLEQTVYPRLYLRREGSLDHAAVTQNAGRRVEVRGDLGEITVGGVEMPRRTFKVLDLQSIRPDVSP
jgi:hypothetical protein